MIGLGASILVALALPRALPPTWSTIVPTLALWSCLCVPVLLGLSRSIPRGLFRLRSVDVLYGLTLGLLLRILQGFLENWQSGSALAVPSYPMLEGVLPVERVLTDVTTGVVFGPLIEELFFRCAFLVAVYTVVRRRRGRPVAASSSILVTTISFVGAHALIAPLTLAQGASLTLLGIGCGVLVLKTGRIWSAVVAHITYNALLVGLTVIGSIFA